MDSALNAAPVEVITVGAPGVQGAVTTGIQGMGVRTPRAAAVAAATVGLLGELHMPKGAMATTGSNCETLAAGIVAVIRLTGRAVSTLGAAPKLQLIVAVDTAQGIQ